MYNIIKFVTEFGEIENYLLKITITCPNTPVA